jgi:hypothetical protein
MYLSFYTPTMTYFDFILNLNYWINQFTYNIVMKLVLKKTFYHYTFFWYRFIIMDFHFIPNLNFWVNDTTNIILMHFTIIFVVWYWNIFMYVHKFVFETFHLFYFSNKKFPIPICGPWLPYAILHILNMCHSTQYPHPPQMVYIKHKTKWPIPSFVGGKHWLWPW